MKKLILLWLAGIALLLFCAGGAAFAHDGGFHGGGGGFHNGGMHSGGMHSGGGQQARHGFHRFHDFRGRAVIVVGGPFYWAPYYYGSTLYPSGAVYMSPDSNDYYYCNDPAGYYPEVASCPGGWLRVVPGDAPY